MGPRWMRMILIAPLAIVAMAIFAFVAGEVVKLLWNGLTPTLFGWRPITFWQAFGLLVLCRILFGGRGYMRSGRSRARQRIRERMAERWEKMTPEERDRYRNSFRGRWGSFEPPGTML